MKAEAKSIKEIFGGGPQKLVVPFFQRRYVWEEENWAELLSSIECNGDIQVFLGSIIRVFEKEKPRQEDCVCSGQIGKCYRYYRQVLQQRRQQELKDIFDIMYNDNNKMLVRIELLENDVNEQSIFDTINRAGAKLSTADIIKNNLFQGFMESCGENQEKIREVNRIYDEKWDRMFYSEEEKNEWDEKRRFGNVKRNNLEFLLYCVASIKWAREDTKDFSGQLDALYSKETKEYDFDSYRQLIEEIHDYARIFSTHITRLHMVMNDKEKVGNEYFSYQADMRRLLLILEEFGVQMFYPFVLKILRDAGENFQDEHLTAQSKMLESFIIRRRIMGTSVSDYTSKCHLILRKGPEKLFSTAGEKEINISDGAVKSQLAQMKGDTAKLLLFLIELSTRDRRSDVDELTYTYTLEHIMPQKWQESWGVPENYVEKRQKHIDDLGNLTLLKISLNSTVRNADFKTKIEGIPKQGRQRAREGYKGNISLNITEEIVKMYDNGMKDWNEERIEERRNRLAEKIIELWPLYQSKS